MRAIWIILGTVNCDTPLKTLFAWKWINWTTSACDVPIFQSDAGLKNIDPIEGVLDIIAQLSSLVGRWACFDVKTINPSGSRTEEAATNPSSF